LLKNCADRPLKSARIVGVTMADGIDADTPDWAADYYLFDRLKRMATPRSSTPLVDVSGDLETDHPEGAMRRTEMAINQSGRDVLAGKASFIDLNGIDEWVGGVRLNADSGELWYFDGERLRRDA